MTTGKQAYSNNSLYRAVGITKQAVHQHKRREKTRAPLVRELCDQITKARKDSPGIGLKKVYKLVKPDWLGRDKFVSLGLSLGYGIPRSRSPIRTTHAIKALYHPNLLTGKRLTGINQGWQSDITYYFCGGRFYYITFIIDVYSRRIVGYAVSDSLRAEANIAALKMAFSCRKGASLQGLIHHSDRGAQYIDKGHQSLLEGKGILSSMCLKPQDNAYSERINGTIKNDYLRYWTIESYSQLKASLRRAVRNYNETRPHNHLPGEMSPLQYEEALRRNPEKYGQGLFIKPGGRPEDYSFSTSPAHPSEGKSKKNNGADTD